jgi:hypothetical protein
MKFNIFVTVAGQEQIAKGEPIHYWNLSLRPAEGVDWQVNAEPGALMVAADIALNPPHKDICVAQAVADLRRRQAEIYANAAKDAAELKEREQSLLALAYSTPLDFPEVQ